MWVEMYHDIHVLGKSYVLDRFSCKQQKPGGHRISEGEIVFVGCVLISDVRIESDK